MGVKIPFILSINVYAHTSLRESLLKRVRDTLEVIRGAVEVSARFPQCVGGARYIFARPFERPPRPSRILPHPLERVGYPLGILFERAG